MRKIIYLLIILVLFNGGLLSDAYCQTNNCTKTFHPVLENADAFSSATMKLSYQEFIIPQLERFETGFNFLSQGASDEEQMKMLMNQFQIVSPIKDTQFDGSHFLSGDVQVAWVKHYAEGNSPGMDAGIDIVVDGAGNIYVVGKSQVPGVPFRFGAYDFTLIKYHPAGQRL